VKFKTKNTFSILTFLGTLFYSKEVTFLYYNSTDSPDFQTYFNYFKYFFNEIENTNREQGLFYYFLNSWNFHLYSNEINSSNFYIYLHKSIQETNFYIYIFGLIGCYFLLKHFKYSESTIFLSLAFLNLAPFMLASRIVLKPEIISFGMLPWIILCFEKFTSERKLLYIYLSIPFILISMSSKGSVFVMLGVFLFIFYFIKILKIGTKNLIFLILIFISLFSLFVFEDSNANGVNLLELQSGQYDYENYNNKAPLSFIYKLDLYKLLTSPIKYTHSNSFISITLLDTFGDYFDLYWDNDSSFFYEDRKSIFRFKETNSIQVPNFNIKEKELTIYVQKEPDVYLRKFISLNLSIIFFTLLILNIRKKNELNKFFIAPLICIGLLLIHVISGFPVNNFDPSKGDTLKTIYYSFFLGISLLFLCANLISKSNYRKFSILPMIFLMVFLIGFPKNNIPENELAITNLNSYSTFCEINELTKLYNTKGAGGSLCNKNTKPPVKGFLNFENYNPYKLKPKFLIINGLMGLICFASSVFIVRSSRKN
tara:strand:- start:4725 stop:6344 length:1620 start_codon:yes stop_codon:yes gene_type:complete